MQRPVYSLFLPVGDEETPHDGDVEERRGRRVAREAGQQGFPGTPGVTTVPVRGRGILAAAVHRVLVRRGTLKCSSRELKTSFVLVFSPDFLNGGSPGFGLFRIRGGYRGDLLDFEICLTRSVFLHGKLEDARFRLEDNVDVNVLLNPNLFDNTRTVYMEGSLKNPSDSCSEGSLKMTTCSSSVLELSSGMVSGKTVSFGEDTQLAFTKFNLTQRSCFFDDNLRRPRRLWISWR